MQILPGILEQDWSAIESKLNVARQFSDTIHLDIIDGKFVDNITFLDPEPFKKYSQDIFIELHMMVEDPESIIEEWAGAGVRRFMGHIEHMPSQKDFVQRAKKYGEAGLALDGPTHIKAIKIPFEELNSILVYTSNKVGFSGPALMEERLDKIQHLKSLTNIPIEADGGVNERTITHAQEAGATRFVATSAIWSAGQPQENFTRLDSLLRTA